MARKAGSLLGARFLFAVDFRTNLYRVPKV